MTNMEAYSKGVNDFIENIRLIGWDSHTSAHLLPPEFYIFGMTGDILEPFTTVDFLAHGRLMSFHLSWNWN